MNKQMFGLSREMAVLLLKYRKKANLTQSDIGVRMGMSAKGAHNIVVRLEKGKVDDPRISTILRYLNACNVQWTQFFGDLANIYSAKTHHEIMTQVKLPDNPKIVKKIDRNLLKYEDNIKTQYQPATLDSVLIEDKITRKIKSYLVSLNTDEKLISVYLDFCYKVMERELSSEKSLPVDENNWICSGIRKMLFPKLRQMVIKTVSTEKKKVFSKKQPSTEKQKKMALAYAKYLANIKPIEAEVHKLLCNIVVPEESYRTYKSFARACYKIIRRDYTDTGKITQIKDKFSEVIDKWIKMGHRQDILEQIRDLVINFFTTVK